MREKEDESPGRSLTNVVGEKIEFSKGTGTLLSPWQNGERSPIVKGDTSKTCRLIPSHDHSDRGLSYYTMDDTSNDSEQPYK